MLEEALIAGEVFRLGERAEDGGQDRDLIPHTSADRSEASEVSRRFPDIMRQLRQTSPVLDLRNHSNRVVPRPLRTPPPLHPRNPSTRVAPRPLRPPPPLVPRPPIGDGTRRSGGYLDQVEVV